MKEEIWKDINNYEGLCQVSSFGSVKSMDTKLYHKTSWGNYTHYNKKGKILKPYRNNKGYSIVRLYKDGKCKYYLVHRLVAETFVPNPDGLPEVDHIDENKNNNIYSNLFWCNRSYNNTKGIQSKEGRRKTASFRMKRVSQYDLGETLLNIYNGVRIAEEQTNVSSANIIKCCKGKSKTAGGYIWRYTDE